MLFKETLEKLLPEVDAALDELFEVVQLKQTHEQDLLLVFINGSYAEHLANPRSKLSPFVFGIGGWNYYSDLTQDRLYYDYKRVINKYTRKAYFKDYESNRDKQAKYEFTLQIELMLYLKFWESERTLKWLSQFSNLCLGKNYDWYFQISKEDKRHEIIRENIRDSIKDVCPKYYQLLKSIYLSQIRNAVAHSQFYIIRPYTRLGFTNYNVKYAPLTQLDFQDWEIRFHKLILLYDGLIKRHNLLHSEYIKRQEGLHFGLSIRIPTISQASDLSFIKYGNYGREDWAWYVNWAKNYRGQ